jgi:toluene monooxygenase system protein E
MPGKRTYRHLEHLGRRPTDYEIATSRLLTHPEHGFAVPSAGAECYSRHGLGARLSLPEWESFDDPRATTYARYTEERKRREVFVDGLLSSEDEGDLGRLDPEWVRAALRALGPLRYPLHGLQMVAAYLGSVAPSGKLVTLFLFLAADQLRAVHRIAYRLKQLARLEPDALDDSMSLWMEDRTWQPLRELTERLLVTKDACDAFSGLCFAAKPMLDELFLSGLGETARFQGDDVLRKLLGSLRDDAAWHLEWTSLLARRLVAASPGNRAALRASVDRFWPLASRAAEALAPVVAENEAGAPALLLAVRGAVASHWSGSDLGLTVVSGRNAEA